MISRIFASLFANTNVKGKHCHDWVYQQEKLPGEHNIVKPAEQEKHYQRQQKVYQRLNTASKQKKILRHLSTFIIK